MVEEATPSRFFDTFTEVGEFVPEELTLRPDEGADFLRLMLPCKRGPSGVAGAFSQTVFSMRCRCIRAKTNDLCLAAPQGPHHEASEDATGCDGQYAAAGQVP